MTTADEPTYIPGNIYTVNERDWLLSRGAIEENMNTEAMPHLLEIYVDYSMAEERAEDSGVFEFLLSCLITHFEQWKRTYYNDANRPQAPNILVDVLPSPCAIVLGGKSPDAVINGAEAISQFFRDPYVPDGKLVSREFFRGTCWHNDSVLRMGINTIAVRPLVIHHETPVLETKMKALAAELSPHSSDRTHLFVTNTASLIGAVFTEKPAPMSVEAFLRQTDRPAPAYFERGSLETDDSTPILSASAPISAEAFIAHDILGSFLQHHFHEIVGERADLAHSQTLWNDHIIHAVAGQGSWTEEEAHDLIRVLLGIDNSLDSPGLLVELTDDKLQEFLIDHILHEKWQIQLWLRRIESGNISKEGVREAVKTFLANLHIPHRIATGPLVEHFPPLTPLRGIRVAYAQEEGYPPALGVDDLDRQFLEPMGEQFWTGLLFDTVNTVQAAPHRLTINDVEIVAEWFVNETPDSALIRRHSVAWADVQAWVMYEQSAILVDRAGRFFELVPEIFLESEKLKAIVEEKKQHCVARGAIIQQLTAKHYRTHIARLIQAREFGFADGAFVDAPWQNDSQHKNTERPVRVSAKGSHMRGNNPQRRIRYLDEREYAEEQNALKKRMTYIYAAAAAIITVMVVKFAGNVLSYLGWL